LNGAAQCHGFGGQVGANKMRLNRDQNGLTKIHLTTNIYLYYCYFVFGIDREEEKVGYNEKGWSFGL